MNVMKYSRDATNRLSTRKQAHPAAKLAGERIDDKSPNELNYKLEEDFEHPRIIALTDGLG